MYAILIVDDEPMIREGIRKAINWEKLRIDNVYTAASVKEAESIFSVKAIDIILTDINMPEETGIEMMERIRRRADDLRIIVLTGYDYFEYARSCLRLNVAEFLLKPIDEQQLENTIAKQVELLDQRQKKMQQEIMVRRLLGTEDQEQVEGMMHRLINEETGYQEDLNAFCKKYQYPKDQKMQIVILLPELSKDNEEESDYEFLTVKKICTGQVDSQQKGITFRKKDKIIMDFFLHENENEVVENLEQLKDILQDEHNTHSKFFIGSVVNGFCNLYISYNDANRLINSAKTSIDEIVQLNQARERADIAQDIIRELKNAMTENIGNKEYFFHVYESFEKATSAYNLTVNRIRKYCIELASAVYYAFICDAGWSMSKYNDSKSLQLAEFMEIIAHSSSKEALSITKNFLDRLGGDNNTSNPEIIMEAVTYIDNHLVEDITVSDIAGALYITPNYLSRLFKRVTNEGCNKYITRKRIEKAQALLHTTSMKTAEIAANVGYHDANYFSLAFKKHVGLSPTVYRENMRKQLDRKLYY